MRLNPLDMLKTALIVAAAAAAVVLIAVDIAVAVVAIEFFTIFAG
jgi:hypothetical protein